MLKIFSLFEKKQHRKPLKTLRIQSQGKTYTFQQIRVFVCIPWKSYGYENEDFKQLPDFSKSHCQENAIAEILRRRKGCERAPSDPERATEKT